MEPWETDGCGWRPKRELTADELRVKAAILEASAATLRLTASFRSATDSARKFGGALQAHEDRLAVEQLLGSLAT